MFPFHNNLLVFWGNISSLGQYKKPKNLTLKDCMVAFLRAGGPTRLFQDVQLSIHQQGSWMP